MQRAGLYAIAKSTAVKIVHNGVTVLRHNLVSASIKFPNGTELEQAIWNFEALCGLPLCAGVLDGTFMRIKKLTEYGDSYYCYKHFTGIIVLGCVDGRGIFTYVTSGAHNMKEHRTLCYMWAHPLVAEPLDNFTTTFPYMEVSLHRRLLATYCGLAHVNV